MFYSLLIVCVSCQFELSEIHLTLTDAEGRMPASSVTFESAETDMDQWRRLEELIIFENTGTLPHRFKPSTQCFTNSTQNDSHPHAVVGGVFRNHKHN